MEILNEYVMEVLKDFLPVTKEEKTFSIIVSLDSTGYKARVDF